MPIYKGNTQIGDIYKGTTSIGEVYKGNILVYSKLRLIDLGVNNSWNIRNYTSKWASLNADNFFFTTTNIASVSGRASGQELATRNTYFIKSYSNGILTMILRVADDNGYRDAQVHGYLVENVSKLDSLGTGTSFNISGKPYKDIVTDGNFLIQSISSVEYDAIRGPGSYTMTANVVRSYNSSSKVFTAYTRSLFSCENPSQTRDRQTAVTVFVYPKKL